MARQQIIPTERLTEFANCDYLARLHDGSLASAQPLGHPLAGVSCGATFGQFGQFGQFPHHLSVRVGDLLSPAIIDASVHGQHSEQ